MFSSFIHLTLSLLTSTFLLITYAFSLDPDQSRLFDTLSDAVPERVFSKNLFLKISRRQQKHEQLPKDKERKLEAYVLLVFSKNYFGNTTRVSNSLDPDQGRQFDWPDLGPNCFA